MKLVTTMTTLGDMTALKAFLDQYAVPKYFHSTVLDETTNPRTLTCYTDSTQNAGMILKAYSSNANGYIVFFNGSESIDFNLSSAAHPAKASLSTDNAVVLFPGSSTALYYSAPIVIAKNDNDQTCLMGGFYRSSSAYYAGGISRSSNSSGFSQLFFGIVTPDAPSSRWLISGNYSIIVSNRSDGKVLGVAYPTLDGIPKNVWVVTSGSFYNVEEPFLYNIDGESYVGVAGNTFIIKST